MNRRHFLKLSTATLTLSLTPSLDFFKTDNLSIQLYSVRNAISENLEKTLEHLAALGLRNLEIYGYDGSFFGLKPMEFWWMLKNTGLKVISSHHLTGITDAAKGSLSVNWEKTLDDLNLIGCQYAVCAYLSEAERKPEDYQRLSGLLDLKGAIASKANIRFGYHNHDFEFEMMNGVRAYDYLLENTSAKNVCMELDLYWISKAGLDPVAYFEKYPGRFELWHVKDMCAGTKDFCEVGNGTIDFSRIFAKKKLAGLKHWFIEQDESKGDIFESLATSVKNVRKMGF